MVTFEQLKQATADTLVKAGSSFRPDQIKAYEDAVATETNEHAKWALETILQNALVADKSKYPLCDDTGIPHIYLEVGEEAVLPANFQGAIREGVVDGLRRLPGRPMAVKGSDLERISQEAGLYDDPGMLAMAPLQVRSIPGDKIRVTVMMYGGGPEIRGKTLRVFHRHSVDTVKKEMIAWATESAEKLGCLPCVFSFGIGRSNYEAAALSMEAMATGDFGVQSDFEKEITVELNKNLFGAMSLGGNHTVLATFVKVGAQPGDEGPQAVHAPQGLVDGEALEQPSGGAAAAAEGIIAVEDAVGALHVRLQAQVVAEE